jgi:phosphonate transport system ATP-binding protein
MIFQHHHLIGRLTVIRNVLMGRIGHQGSLRSVLPPSREDRLLALRILDRLGMVDRALDRADQLSGGQQQRVGIARALAQTPQIVLADEPIASLDPRSAEQVLSDLHRICREDGITAVLSLHQPEFARRFADRIIGLREGRIVFDGLPRDLTPNVTERIYGSSDPLVARAAE